MHAVPPNSPEYAHRDILNAGHTSHFLPSASLQDPNFFANNANFYRTKHKHQDLEDDDDEPLGIGERFSNIDNVEDYPTGVSSLSKRRKTNKGHALGFEPHFDALSLSNSTGRVAASELTGDDASLSNVPQYPLYSQRESTPFPFQAGTPSSTSGNEGNYSNIPPTRHKRGASQQSSPSSSAASSSYRFHRPSDARMKPVPRHDPSRPHVVFIDSLDESDEDADTEDNSRRPSTSNSTSSDTSDMDGEGASSFQPTSNRPVKLNRRLREHLWRQNYENRGNLAPSMERFPLSDPHLPGGAGIQERGLVLYRPLSFGIVEEPDDEPPKYFEDESRFEEVDDVGQHGFSIEELDPVSQQPVHALPSEPSFDPETEGGMDLD